MGKRVKSRLKSCFCGLALSLLASGAAAACLPGKIEVQGPFGTVAFEVEVADSFASRARGLMHRSEMADSAGMLFIYPHTQEVAFWMKNTLIPLDMIFINGRGIVHKVHAEAIPGDLTSIPSDGAIRSVLEINGGLAGEIGIRPGALVRHFDLPQRRAAWPC